MKIGYVVDFMSMYDDVFERWNKTAELRKMKVLGLYYICICMDVNLVYAVEKCICIYTVLEYGLCLCLLGISPC